MSLKNCNQSKNLETIDVWPEPYDDTIERGDYIGIRSWGKRNMGDTPTSPSCAGKLCFEFS